MDIVFFYIFVYFVNSILAKSIKTVTLAFALIYYLISSRNQRFLLIKAFIIIQVFIELSLNYLIHDSIFTSNKFGLDNHYYNIRSIPQLIVFGQYIII